MRCLVLLCLLAVALPLSADIYKCRSDDGVRFADEPCGENAVRVEAEAALIGGDLSTDRVRDQVMVESRESRESSASVSCPHIQSTRLNTLTIRNQIVSGMTREQVRRSWRAPDSISSGPDGTQWAYHWSDGDSDYVYFENGCVADFGEYVTQ